MGELCSPEITKLLQIKMIAMNEVAVERANTVRPYNFCKILKGFIQAFFKAIIRFTLL